MLNYLKLKQRLKIFLLEVEQIKKASYDEINKYKDEASLLRNIMQNFVVQVDSLNTRK